MQIIISDHITLPCDGEFYSKTISLEDARSFCRGDISSAVSDPLIADILTELLGVQIEVNPTPLKPECGQTIVYFQLKNYPENSYEFKVLKIVKENTSVKKGADNTPKRLPTHAKTFDGKYYFK